MQEKGLDTYTPGMGGAEDLLAEPAGGAWVATQVCARAVGRLGEAVGSSALTISASSGAASAAAVNLEYILALLRLIRRSRCGNALLLFCNKTAESGVYIF